MNIKLLIVDDHTVVRSGLYMLLEGAKDIEIIGEAGSWMSRRPDFTSTTSASF